jgi:hypothetical protein
MNVNLFKRLSLLISIIFFLISCEENPFLNNIFSSFDKYELPSSFSSVGDVLDASSDDQFIDELVKNDELTDDVIDLLDDCIGKDPSNADSEDQEAALLLADIYLARVNADDTINNVNDLLVEFMNDSESLDFSTPEAILQDLFLLDPSLSVDEQKNLVEAQLSALVAASQALAFYGLTMSEGGLDPSVEVNAGETAVIAIISGLTEFLITNMECSTQDEAIVALAATIVEDEPLPSLNSDAQDELDADSTFEEMLDNILADGLTDVINDGFNLDTFDDM